MPNDGQLIVYSSFTYQFDSCLRMHLAPAVQVISQDQFRISQSCISLDDDVKQPVVNH